MKYWVIGRSKIITLRYWFWRWVLLLINTLMSYLLFTSFEGLPLLSVLPHRARPMAAGPWPGQRLLHAILLISFLIDFDNNLKVYYFDSQIFTVWYCFIPRQIMQRSSHVTYCIDTHSIYIFISIFHTAEAASRIYIYWEAPAISHTY